MSDDPKLLTREDLEWRLDSAYVPTVYGGDSNTIEGTLRIFKDFRSEVLRHLLATSSLDLPAARSAEEIATDPARMRSERDQLAGKLRLAESDNDSVRETLKDCDAYASSDPTAMAREASQRMHELRAEIDRLHVVIKTGGAMLRAERAQLGVPGGIEPADELQPLRDRMAKARAKYPSGPWPFSLWDEFGEVGRALNKREGAARFCDELLDLAGVAMRLYAGEFDPRPQPDYADEVRALRREPATEGR